MCPNRSFVAPRAQAGFLMPVALFIIVVLGLGALALGRLTSQSSVSSVQEVISVQALYAAESAVQAGLSELFYPNASAREAVDARCESMAWSQHFSGVEGLNLCSASVTCERAEPGLYTLSAEGRCGDGGAVSAARLLKVQAKW